MYCNALTQHRTTAGASWPTAHLFVGASTVGKDEPLRAVVSARPLDVTLIRQVSRTIGAKAKYENKYFII